MNDLSLVLPGLLRLLGAAGRHLGGRLPEDRERGDIPGWVLITVMTAALVTVIWTLVGDQITTMMTNVLDSVGPTTPAG